jgi:cold shock CspA family protein
MNVPPTISFRDVPRTEALDALINHRCDKLTTICDYLQSCRVMVERTQRHQQRGRSYRVRIDMTVPPGHELAVKREPSRGDLHQSLESEIREAFDAAERQLKELKGKQEGHVKQHADQSTSAVVDRLFPAQDYGFLRTLDGRNIYFHRNSVLEDDFDRLSVGTGVTFTEVMGNEGPQASTVKIIDKPGSRAGRESRQGEVRG